MNRIEYIITAGGTREPVDAVRFIGNISTGRLGACIADEAHSRGHAVRFIHGAGCCMPRCRDEAVLEGFVTSSDLRRILEKCVKSAGRPAVLVHAAAVSDYIPSKVEGKIPSDQDELVIRLRRAKKIVDSIKTWNPEIQLVKFKLEANCTQEELLTAGIKAGRRAGAEWVVANDTSALSGDSHHALIIRSNGSHIEARGKPEIARRLLDETERRVLTLNRRETE
jgi:phosphopantothenate-cysteine ligase